MAANLGKRIFDILGRRAIRIVAGETDVLLKIDQKLGIMGRRIIGHGPAVRLVTILAGPAHRRVGDGLEGRAILAARPECAAGGVEVGRRRGGVGQGMAIQAERQPVGLAQQAPVRS